MSVYAWCPVDYFPTVCDGLHNLLDGNGSMPPLNVGFESAINVVVLVCLSYAMASNLSSDSNGLPVLLIGTIVVMLVIPNSTAFDLTIKFTAMMVALVFQKDTSALSLLLLIPGAFLLFGLATAYDIRATEGVAIELVGWAASTVIFAVALRNPPFLLVIILVLSFIAFTHHEAFYEIIQLFT